MGVSSASIPALRVAIAGLGTVGAGTLGILQRTQNTLQARANREIKVVAVSARDAAKSRALNLDGIDFTSDALSLALRDDIDVVIELIGGENGIAYDLVKAALKNGKHVVTANKALMAHHGLALAKWAEASGVMLAFEAAVAGGIPIISALRTGLSANHITDITGILNGTCNYILSRMYHENLDQSVVMEQAAKLGWLEANPALDIDGIDAAHKLALLASLAFGTQLDFNGVKAHGIRDITLQDMHYAGDFGYRIKLLAQANYHEGKLSQQVYPALVKKSHQLANIEGACNAIMLQGDAVGSVMLQGQGAGAGPTGSAVVADIIAIARGDQFSPFTVKATDLSPAKPADLLQQQSAFYLRLSLQDMSGALAEVTRVLDAHHISVRMMHQDDVANNAVAQVAVLTHQTSAHAAHEAFASLAKLPYCSAKPIMMRVLEPDEST
jgi:homoserine dehydrogenase